MISRTSRLRLAAVAALLASSLLHVAAMAIAPEFGQEILVEGGAGENEAVLGSDFADLIKAGNRLDPVETPETAATSPEHVAAMTVPPVQDAPAPPLEKLEPAENNDMVAPSQPERLEAVAPQAPVVRPNIERPKPITSARPEQPRTRRIEPAKPAKTVTPVDDPKPIKAPVPRPKPRQEPKKPEKRAAKSSAGSETSKSKVSNKAGSRDGKTEAKAKSSGKRKSKQSSANSGNAAAANYPGKVYAKIARTRRRNAGGRGVAHVSFHVSPSGQAVRIRVSRSSGNARVDRAAIAHIKRAAPFPRPPAGAQTRFVIPIEFRS